MGARETELSWRPSLPGGNINWGERGTTKSGGTDTGKVWGPRVLWREVRGFRVCSRRERGGYVSVQVEPPEAMRIAGQMAIPALPYYAEHKARTGNQDQPWAYATACYKAMLAAAQKEEKP